MTPRKPYNTQQLLAAAQHFLHKDSADTDAQTALSLVVLNLRNRQTLAPPEAVPRVERLLTRWRAEK